MFYIPLTTNPIGWVILGLGGYALYRSGKKKGQEEAATGQITTANNNAQDKTVNMQTEGGK
ncbi:MAG: hypothetical protein CSA20_07785 [Deltaproteobacteria bacterium]|nr:MAG: hypothetical protein CSB23_04250 [Deltaproteobacteria bacterium]PIE72437.1 MAG: hypothetical protein CSA20_07785 [Deltaproteobacteria bacterium]